jgi:hypothetical protein
VVRDLAAHRAQQQVAESPAAAGPHDEQVGVARRPDELFGRIALKHAHGDLGRRLGDLARHLVYQFLYGLPRWLRVEGARDVRHVPVDPGGYAGGGRVHRHDRQRDVVLRGLAHGPGQGVAGVIRAVDPDDDSGHRTQPTRPVT